MFDWIRKNMSVAVQLKFYREFSEYLKTVIFAKHAWQILSELKLDYDLLTLLPLVLSLQEVIVFMNNFLGNICFRINLHDSNNVRKACITISLDIAKL